MHTPDSLPPLQPNQQFPMGDIVDYHKDKKVDQWFCSVAAMERERFWSLIRLYSQPTHIDGANANATHAATVTLCGEWDNTTEGMAPYSHMGYRLAMTFNQQTRYLPKCDINLTDTIERMQQLEIISNDTCSVRAFGRTAWNSVAVYTNVYATHQRLMSFAYDRYGLHNDNANERFKAGLVLPFMFAWISRLDGYMRRAIDKHIV